MNTGSTLWDIILFTLMALLIIGSVSGLIRVWVKWIKWMNEATKSKEEKEEEGHRIITQEERLERAKAELEFMRKHPGTRC